MEEIKKIKCFVIDLDGVVYKGSELVPGMDRRIASLQRKAKVIFLTNNSTRSRAQYVKKLNGFGIFITEDDIVTSGYAAAKYIKEKYPRGKVYVIGEDGLKKELEWQGVQVCWRDCDIVLVGLDRNINYMKLSFALNFISRGARFIATNTDNTLVTEKGLMPGAGAIVSAVRMASRKEPTIIGKPSEIVGDIILRKAGVDPQDILVIGDRLETDIAMGKKCGMKTALVLTGYATNEEVKHSPIKPDFVLEKL